MSLYVGTAGWSIPRKDADQFPAEGTILQRYAARLRGVEINSSFYRPHRPGTWQRWAESVPEDFRFSVKLPRTISHERRLVDCAEPLGRFLDEVANLGNNLAVLLLQLPPRLEFDAAVSEAFFNRRFPAPLVCEPRHPSWFVPEAEALLERLGIARVAADPACVPAAAISGGWRGLSYWRLHGSPDMYRTPYDDARIAAYAASIRADLNAGRTVWCVFDNTASFAATGNALDLLDRLEPGGPPERCPRKGGTI